MRSRAAIALLSLSLLSLPGCATCLSLASKDQGSKVYSGTRIHLENLKSPEFKKSAIHPVTPLFFADFAVSAVADTLVLPYTLTTRSGAHGFPDSD